MTTTSAEIRADFTRAALAFVEIVAAIPSTSWADPGLGKWNVRDLVGHTSRSLVTVEAYLASPIPVGVEPIGDAVGYYAAAATIIAEPTAVVERGRQAGKALGDDPVAAVRSLAERVTALVAVTPDDAPVATIVGPMRLIDYLPTRIFELVVHCLDLVEATQVALPPSVPVQSGLDLATRLAADPAAVLLALTGRRPLETGFSVV